MIKLGWKNPDKSMKKSNTPGKCYSCGENFKELLTWSSDKEIIYSCKQCTAIEHACLLDENDWLIFPSEGSQYNALKISRIIQGATSIDNQIIKFINHNKDRLISINKDRLTLNNKENTIAIMKCKQYIIDNLEYSLKEKYSIFNIWSSFKTLTDNKFNMAYLTMCSLSKAYIEKCRTTYGVTPLEKLMEYPESVIAVPKVNNQNKENSNFNGITPYYRKPVEYSKSIIAVSKVKGIDYDQLDYSEFNSVTERLFEEYIFNILCILLSNPSLMQENIMPNINARDMNDDKLIRHHSNLIAIFDNNPDLKIISQREKLNGMRKCLSDLDKIIYSEED